MLDIYNVYRKTEVAIYNYVMYLKKKNIFLFCLFLYINNDICEHNKCISNRTLYNRNVLLSNLRFIRDKNEVSAE